MSPDSSSQMMMMMDMTMLMMMMTRTRSKFVPLELCHRYVIASFQPWSRTTPSEAVTIQKNLPELLLSSSKNLYIRNCGFHLKWSHDMFLWGPFQPPWENLRGKFTTAALCDSGRIWLKNWGQMAVRCRHGEWVAVKWQRGQYTLLLCKFSTLDSIKTIHMIHSTQLIFWTMKTLF